MPLACEPTCPQTKGMFECIGTNPYLCIAKWQDLLKLMYA